MKVSEGEEEDEEEDEELNDEDVKESETEEVEAEAEAEEKEEAHDSESEAMENKFSEEMDESLVRKTTMEDFAVSAVKPKAKRVKQSAVAARSIKTPKIPNPKPKAEPPTKKVKHLLLFIYYYSFIDYKLLMPPYDTLFISDV